MHIYLTDTLLKSYVRSGEAAKKNRVLGWDEGKRGKQTFRQKDWNTY